MSRETNTPRVRSLRPSTRSSSVARSTSVLRSRMSSAWMSMSTVSRSGTTWSSTSVRDLMAMFSLRYVHSGSAIHQILTTALARLGSVLRISLRPPAHHCRRYLPPRPHDGQGEQVRCFNFEEAHEGHAYWPGYLPSLVLPSCRRSPVRPVPAACPRSP